MIKQPSFYVCTASFNTDQLLELSEKLKNFGFIDTSDDEDDNIRAIENADVTIVILPEDDINNSIINYIVSIDKPLIIVGKCCERDLTNLYNYENVFIINEIGKSSEIINKHLSELYNVYNTKELE